MVDVNVWFQISNNTMLKNFKRNKVLYGDDVSLDLRPYSKRMKIHREGFKILIIWGLFLFASCLLLNIFVYNNDAFLYGSIISALVLFTLVLQFFRSPTRVLTQGEDAIVSPADGVVVTIEKVMENEYLKKECMLISVFMSPLNVHVNRYAISGEVTYFKYHPGKYLVASHPKSSTENERTTVVVEQNGERKVLMRQIAGYVARRIVSYCKRGDFARQTDEFGFIKFGSRVDVYVPLNAKILVELNQKVKGGVSVLAEFTK